MEIVWQTPANPPERHDYIFRDGNITKNIFLNFENISTAFALHFFRCSIFMAGITLQVCAT